MRQKRTIATQADWLSVRPQFGSASEYRRFRAAYKFDPTSRIARTGVPIEGVLSLRAAQRRRIFEECLVDGRTVRDANTCARVVSSNTEHDAEIFIGLFSGFIHLPE